MAAGTAGVGGASGTSGLGGTGGGSMCGDGRIDASANEQCEQGMPITVTCEGLNMGTGMIVCANCRLMMLCGGGGGMGGGNGAGSGG